MHRAFSRHSMQFTSRQSPSQFPQGEAGSRSIDAHEECAKAEASVLFLLPRLSGAPSAKKQTFMTMVGVVALKRSSRRHRAARRQYCAGQNRIESRDLVNFGGALLALHFTALKPAYGFATFSTPGAFIFPLSEYRNFEITRIRSMQNKVQDSK